jgi:methyltransferase (TIGR00027 family)
VVNLAAGLDARPYRIQLPATLRWAEVDLPEILSYKEAILANEKPSCQLERIRLDLSDTQARRAFFAEMDSRATRIVVLTEGLLVYFTSEEVSSLARDLAATAHFESWIIDLVSPGQLRLLQHTMGKGLAEAGVPFKFGPPEGPNFFVPHGWEPNDVQGLLKTAAQFNRVPTELLSFLPEPEGAPGNFPWSGVCLLKKRESLLRGNRGAA